MHIEIVHIGWLLVQKLLWLPQINAVEIQPQLLSRHLTKGCFSMMTTWTTSTGRCPSLRWSLEALDQAKEVGNILSKHLERHRQFCIWPVQASVCRWLPTTSLPIMVKTIVHARRKFANSIAIIIAKKIGVDNVKSTLVVQLCWLEDSAIMMECSFLKKCRRLGTLIVWNVLPLCNVCDIVLKVST